MSLHRWDVVAQDYNSPLHRNYTWVRALAQIQSHLIDVPLLKIGIISRANAIDYVADLSTWQRVHEALRSKIEKDYAWLGALMDTIDREGEAMNTWSGKEIYARDLHDISNAELWELIEAAYQKIAVVYAYGVAVPILDFQGFAYVERHLEEYLHSRVFPNEYQDYFQVFTQPVQNSFAQDQEEALLRLADGWYANKEWYRAVPIISFADMEKTFPEFAQALSVHAEKFGWVYYVYAGPAYTSVQFYQMIQDSLLQSLDPGLELQKIKNRKNEFAEKRENYLKKLQPNEFEKAILDYANRIVWSKPRRKDYQSKTYFHIEKALREAGKRLFLSLDQVRATPLYMLKDALVDGKDIHAHEIQSFYKYHIVAPQDNEQVEVLTGDAAREFELTHVARTEEEQLSEVKEISGTSACPGRVSGRVRVINQTHEMQKMEYGDILVSIATTPAIVSAMKKAAAIITDEGGLTCHASIVSREMNIPCVIGTKIATKVLKDGDIVEVDANKGLVKILK